MSLLSVMFFFAVYSGRGLIFIQVLFFLTSAVAWYVWSFMRQIGTIKSGGAVTDLNLGGSISE